MLLYNMKIKLKYPGFRTLCQPDADGDYPEQYAILLINAGLADEICDKEKGKKHVSKNRNKADN